MTKAKAKTKPRVPAIPLCPYQERWVADKSRFKIAAKARRIGFTFATTLEIALDLISRRTRWLIISRTQDTAMEALREIGNHFKAMKVAVSNQSRDRESGVPDRRRACWGAKGAGAPAANPSSDRLPSGALAKDGEGAVIQEHPTGLFFDGVKINKLVIELPNGSEVTAMTAHPDAARGFGGNVFLDEHGFHRDSEELWKGASAAVLRGHRLIVVSTPHYQTGNYYRLAREADLISGRPPLQVTGDRLQVTGSKEQPSSPPAVTCNLKPKTSLWSAHWVDIHTAAPQLADIGVPIDLAELRQLAGNEEAWNQEFCCQFLSAAEMWIPLELIAAARSPQANLEWDPEKVTGYREQVTAGMNTASYNLSPVTCNLFVGADIGRKHDRTQIWIDERIADVAICRGLITLDRTPFEQQFQVLCEVIAHPRVRRASIDQTGIGMALVERLQEKFGMKVEGVTFTADAKERMSLLVRRRFEERLDKIPENSPAVERDLAAVKRQATSSGNLRFDADRTEAGHADIYWAKALADLAADSSAAAVCLGSDPERSQASGLARLGLRNAGGEAARPSIWDGDREADEMGIFA